MVQSFKVEYPEVLLSCIASAEGKARAFSDFGLEVIILKPLWHGAFASLVSAYSSKVIILTQLLVLYVWSGIQKLGKKLHRYLENDRGDLGDLPDCCPH